MLSGLLGVCCALALSSHYVDATGDIILKLYRWMGKDKSATWILQFICKKKKRERRFYVSCNYAIMQSKHWQAIIGSFSSSIYPDQGHSGYGAWETSSQDGRICTWWDASPLQESMFTHTFTTSDNPPTDMFLDSGRKPENPEETHSNMWRTNIQHSELRIKPRTPELWGSNTILCTTNRHSTSTL